MGLLCVLGTLLLAVTLDSGRLEVRPLDEPEVRHPAAVEHDAQAEELIQDRNTEGDYQRQDRERW